MCGLFEKDLIFGTCRKKLLSTNYLKFMEVLIQCTHKRHEDKERASLLADVLWASFVTHSWGRMRDKRTPKDVCGEARRGHDLMIITT